MNFVPAIAYLLCLALPGSAWVLLSYDLRTILCTSVENVDILKYTKIYRSVRHFPWKEIRPSNDMRAGWLSVKITLEEDDVAI